MKLHLLTKSMSGEEITREFINVLSVANSIDSSWLLACMHDRASTNGVAVCTLKITYPKLFDMGCFLHTVDHVGEYFSIHILSVSSPVHGSQCFLIAPKVRLIWKEQTG